MASFAGYKLANAREARGWDQKTLAEQSGVSRSVVSALESGKTAHPRPVTVNLLAAALDITPRELYKRRSPRRITQAGAQPAEATQTVHEQGLFPAPETTNEQWTSVVEQSALLHELPHRWRILFNGCQEAGFDEAQSMRLVTTAITAGALG